MNNEAMNLAINQVAPAVVDEIWNRAIEAAAKFSETDIVNSAIGLGDRIRALKK